jgi:glutathione S-transferase
MHSSFAVLRDRCSMNCGLRVVLHEMPEALVKDIARVSEIWAEGVKRFGGPFLTGRAFTAADAFYAPVAFRVQTYGLTLDPAAHGYAQQLLDLPSMRGWYAAALGETIRDEEHDKATMRYGKITQDLRAKVG